MKKLEKFFTNSKVMITFGVLSAILFIFGYVPYLFDSTQPQYMFDFIPSTMFAIVIFYLLYAFKKGETNIQKALMGALLFYFAQSSFMNGFYYLEDAAYQISDSAYFYGTVYMIAGMFEYIIFFSHVALQSDHVGSKALIKINQISCFVVLIVYIFAIFHQFITYGINLETIYVFVDFAEALFVFTIVCMETKIQNYKETRANAIANNNWTAEVKAQAKEEFRK